MDVFEFAMKMELDGKAWYEKAAAQTKDSALKNILLEMARDEQMHYELFRSYRDGGADVVMKPTKVLANAKTLFENLAAAGPAEYAGDEVAVWKELLENETNAENFYLEKAAESDDEQTKSTLEMIAAEERRHRIVIEHMVQFLTAPKTWIENAEWTHLDQY